MRKALTVFLTPLFLILLSVPALGSGHLEDLKSKFPYGLLGDDYGVLFVSDLTLNACHFKPEPFVPGAMTPYEYWQCFENGSISVECDHKGSLEDMGGPAGWVVIRVSGDQTTHEFIERRPWDLKDCNDFVSDLKKLMLGTIHSCISASYIENDKSEAGRKSFIGFLGRFKTRKGCAGEECELTDQVRKEYCPDLKI